MTVIDSPVINGPYDEPRRHFVFDDDGITSEIAEGRRRSEYFVPVPQTRKKGAQLQFDNEWTAERIKPNEFVNDVRARVDIWRHRGYPDVTPTSRRLLEFWSDASRDNKILFCQREAAEVAIYLAEVAQKDGQQWLAVRLADYAAEFNAGLPRLAIKMATGSGKTVVMAMLIAWQVLNKVAAPNDARFARRFLVVTPGVTIKDRLRVLQPGSPGNYFRERDLVPSDLLSSLGQAQIVITNYHVFLPRVTREGAGLAAATKSLLLGGRDGLIDPFVESPAQVATRVAREFGFSRGQLVVLNDEAHHCYRDKPDERLVEDMDADEKVEAKDREDEARVWFKGLQGLHAKLGLKTVYDLSATPFFLNGSGYGQGVMFPWVVSDFSLVDAIECGIVKVPRLPVDDNSSGETVVFRNLWDEIADDPNFPKKVSKAPAVRTEEPRLPAKLEGALLTLYANYAKAFASWHARAEVGETPPVFIVVCNNTTVSKLVADWIAGYERATTVDGQNVVTASPGHLPLFANVENDSWLTSPRTLLIDSLQLESGKQLTDEFRNLAAREIEEFVTELRTRFPERGHEEISEADLLREVMNTVGKPGKLGAGIRCVVSVSMLTEGWDANTVSHILGVRAFRTPLLTEQVVGRGLRRRSYDVNADGLFEPEYAEVFGIPFAFIPSSGAPKDPKPRRAPVRVRSLPERAAARITFPRLIGYRLSLPDPDFDADFTVPSARISISTDIIPTTTHVSDVTGFSGPRYPDSLVHLRDQEVAYRLAHRLIDRELRDDLDNSRPWLYPNIVRLIKRWMAEAVDYADGTYPGLLLLRDVTERAVEKITKAIVAKEKQEVLLPIFDSLRQGSTDGVDFDTSRPAYATESERSHVSHVVLDSGWEKGVAESLESMSGVAAYAKNDHLDFDIPYVFAGRAARYRPDFLVRLQGADSVVRTLIVEVSGGAKLHHSPGAVAEKASTAKELWLPAVNSNGEWGQWGYVEVGEPESARPLIEQALHELAGLVPA